MARQPVEGEARDVGKGGLEDRAADLADELDVAERRPALAVVEIIVVEGEGLLVDGIVPPARVDGDEGGRIVLHEIAADRVGAIGDAVRAGAAGGAEQDRGGVDRAGGKHHDRWRDAAKLAALHVFDRGDAPAVGRRDEPLDHGIGDEADILEFQRDGERGALGVELAAAGIRIGVPGRRATLQPAVEIDGERQREGLQPDAAQALA